MCTFWNNTIDGIMVSLSTESIIFLLFTLRENDLEQKQNILTFTTDVGDVMTGWWETEAKVEGPLVPTDHPFIYTE